MPPPLPISLSPHICVLPSPDLVELLHSSSLPPLHNVLQSFCPLPQITTRTTTLTSVPHSNFMLRFSDLVEIEAACKEDEEQRAGRTIDWMTARIVKRCSAWIDIVERTGEETLKDGRTPWWEEMRRCAEGDSVPSRFEGWNHPVAIILAVSTTAPNPLQAITSLHARQSELPPWVDSTNLRYTLIIHPQDSALNDEEAAALFNAAKKQFGLNVYLLSLAVPSPPPLPVAVPANLPRLPPPPSLDGPSHNGQISPESPIPLSQDDGSQPSLNTICLSERDIRETARFVREFVTTSLIPWMEKCVVDWNEAYSSTRRLPSRLFSSTRRLFGTSSYAPTNTSILPTPTNSTHSHSTSFGSITNASATVPPPQRRRLAEFATMLGDFKLAVSVLEPLRRESKDNHGSDILPLLLAPSPALQQHASNALSMIFPTVSGLSAQAQLRALIYAVRWDNGINSSDFLSSTLEGDRWLVWAAGNAEESPAAILVAQAGLLAARRGCRRRAAMWYVTAARRLEKCGIKPLTMYFLRKARQLYNSKPEIILSPLFADAHDKTPDCVDTFDTIIPSIEHSLGRLMYKTGDTESAVRLFLGLLRGSSIPAPRNDVFINGHEPHPANEGSDKIYLEDFRVAFQHLITTVGQAAIPEGLQLPLKFVCPQKTKIRLNRDHLNEDSIWDQLEHQWKEYYKTRTSDKLGTNGTAFTRECFWVDLVLKNPLDGSLTLSDLTIAVRMTCPNDSDFLEIERIDELVLHPKETRTVPISIKSNRPASLIISHLSYTFLSFLPCTESLSVRGRRLQETALQRQNKMYAPDVSLEVEVEEGDRRLEVTFLDEQPLVLAHGEVKEVTMRVSNTGSKDVKDLWMVQGPEDILWLDPDPAPNGTLEPGGSSQVMQSSNCISPPDPILLRLDHLHNSSVLHPTDAFNAHLVLQANYVGDRRLCLLFVFRENETQAFRSVRATLALTVRPLFEISVTSEPSLNHEYLFILNIQAKNVSAMSGAQISQITTLSPTWSSVLLSEELSLESVPPHQVTQTFLGASRWSCATGGQKTIDFVTQKLADILHGRPIEPSKPPPIDILFSHSSESGHVRNLSRPKMQHLITSGRRNLVTHSVMTAHQYIPIVSHAYIFPLYNPSAVDVVLFWDAPSDQRSGFVLVSGLLLGADQAALEDDIRAVEEGKVRRSMFAETQRKREDILDAIRTSEWNLETNPVITVIHSEGQIEHDFMTGPCKVPVTFTLRNYSSTHDVQFRLRLSSFEPTNIRAPDLLPPSYTGPLTHRGSLRPLQVFAVSAKMWVTQPGTYALSGWQLETSVLESSRGFVAVVDSEGLTSRRVRHRYVDGPRAGDLTCITIVARPSSQSI